MYDRVLEEAAERIDKAGSEVDYDRRKMAGKAGIVSGAVLGAAGDPFAGVAMTATGAAMYLSGRFGSYDDSVRPLLEQSTECRDGKIFFD